MSLVHYTECPVCQSKNINPLLTIPDFSVTKETFVIWQCGNCSLRFTQDVPDEDSIGPYYKSENYISHTNTNKGFINKAYQKVRNHTLLQKAALIEKSTGVEKGKLLDVGCGTGAFLHTMKEKGWETSGIEPDADARKLAKDLYKLTISEPAALAGLAPQSFDAITLWHVLEHVHNLHGYVQQLRSLLKENGRLFVAVPNYQSLDASLYSVHWAAYDVPRHLYHFTPKSIKMLMEKNGLHIDEKKPMWFDSFYISMLSSKYRSGQTHYLSAFVNGLRSNLTALINRDRCSSLVYVIKKA